MTITKPTRDKAVAVINASTAHLYNYSPEGTEHDTRYVFTDGTFNSLTEAYFHALETQP